MSITLDCNNGQPSSIVFLDTHIPTPSNALCLDTTTQAAYLTNLFQTSTDACTKTRSGAFTPVSNATSHTTNITILTCTNIHITYQVKNAFFDFTYNPFPITGMQVVVTGTSNAPTITTMNS